MKDGVFPAGMKNGLDGGNGDPNFESLEEQLR